MTRRGAFIAAVALAALAGALAGAASAGTAYFESPSGNIVCGAFSGGGYAPSLECGVASGLVPLPRRPSAANCHGLDFAANRLRLGKSGSYSTFCAGDVGVLAEQHLAPTLAYGKSWHSGPFTCNSASTGVSCHNASGHGFFLSRGHWHAI